MRRLRTCAGNRRHRTGLVAGGATSRSRSRRGAGWLIAALVGVMLATPDAARAQLHPEAVVKEIGPLVADAFRDRGDGVLWEGQVAPQPEALYLRLRFTDIAVPAEAQFTVTVRRPDGRALERYTAEELRRGPVLYSGVLFADAVRVQLEGTPPLAGVSFRIDRLLVGTRGRITPHTAVPNWKDVWEMGKNPAVLEAREAVAKLFIGSGVTCTGFLVAPRALLTNHHCLAESLVYQDTRDRPAPGCSDIVAHFDFERDSQPDAVTRARCADVLKTDAGLDYALLELDSVLGPGGQGSRRLLRLSSQPVPVTTEVLILHHPGGLAKKVSTGCAVFPGGPVTLEHDCGTIGGSSGSPVLGTDGLVLALHHEGAVPKDMTFGMFEELLRQGHVFRNKAKPAHLLLQELRPFLP